MVLQRVDAKDRMEFVVALEVPARGLQLTGETWGFHTSLGRLK